MQDQSPTMNLDSLWCFAIKASTTNLEMFPDHSSCELSISIDCLFYWFNTSNLGPLECMTIVQVPYKPHWAGVKCCRGARRTLAGNTWVAKSILLRSLFSWALAWVELSFQCTCFGFPLHFFSFTNDCCIPSRVQQSKDLYKTSLMIQLIKLNLQS